MAAIKTEALCNKLQFIVSFNKDIPHFYVDKTNVQAFIPIGAKNPEEGEYIVLYALATPIETPLTPAELAAYKALTTYAPNTVVQASDGAGVKLGYQRDVNIAIKKLEDAIKSKARHDLTLRSIKREIAAGRDVAYWLDKAYTHLDNGLLSEADIEEIEVLAQAYYDALDAVEEAGDPMEEID